MTVQLQLYTRYASTTPENVVYPFRRSPTIFLTGRP